MNKLLLFFPIIYFSIAWFFPWGKIQPDMTVSISYVFDLFFVAVLWSLTRNKKIIGNIKLNKLIGKIIITGIFALLCIFISHTLKLKTPFKYIDHLWLQILILAPIIEELVFREAIFELHKKLKLKMKYLIIANALLFSISHIPALFYLPPEFHSFIYFQIIYTVGLGWMCAKSKQQTLGISEPILLHFLFNLIFFIAASMSYV